jgi:hypothetical protein
MVWRFGDCEIVERPLVTGRICYVLRIACRAQDFWDDYYYKLYQTSRQIREAAKTDTAPVRDAKASSLSFYQKGAWHYILHEALGREKFNLVIRNYLNKYAYRNVTTEISSNRLSSLPISIPRHSSRNGSTVPSFPRMT